MFHMNLSFFVSQGAVENGTSLFTYDTEFLLNNFFYEKKHNASFLPVFFPYEDPADPLVKEMHSLCDSDPFCRFDVLTTRSLQVGSSTKLSHQNRKLLVENLQPGDATFHKASITTVLSAGYLCSWHCSRGLCSAVGSRTCKHRFWEELSLYQEDSALVGYLEKHKINFFQLAYKSLSFHKLPLKCHLNHCDGDLLVQIKNTLTRCVSFTSDLLWLAGSPSQWKKEWNCLPAGLNHQFHLRWGLRTQWVKGKNLPSDRGLVWRHTQLHPGNRSVSF